jgi:O-antigen/teichoic acid export membrane protein
MSLFRKAILVNSSAMVCLAVGVLQAVLFSRVLGPAKVGQLSLLLSVLMFVPQLVSLGIPLSFLYHSQHEPARTRVWLINAIWLMLLLGIAGGMLVVGIVYFMPEYFGTVDTFVLFAMLLYVHSVLQRAVSRNYLLISIQARRLSLMELVASVGSLLVMVLLVYFGLLTVSMALLCFILAAVIRAAMGWWWMRDEVDFTIKPSMHVGKRLGLMGVRQSWSDLMVIFNAQLNILLIKFFLDNFESVGYFSRGQSIAMLAVTAGQAVLPMLFSRWASMPETNLGLHVEKVLRFASTLGAFIMAFVLVGSKWLVLLLYGREFLSAVGPMMILVPGTVLYLLSNCITQLLGSRGIPELAAFLLFTSAALNAVLSWVLIPRIGINGAAIAATLGNILLLGALLAVIKAKYNVRLTKCFLVRRDDISTMNIFKSREAVHV